MAKAKEVELPFTPCGQLLDLWYRIIDDKDPPLPGVLVHGAAGTGKSRGILEIIWHLANEYPNSRYLISRKTRVSMSESILATLEQHVIPSSDPCLGGAHRSNRTGYRLKNGSEIVLYGFDDPERIKSSEYDVIYINEANEISPTDWEIACSRLRNNKIPMPNFGLMDCNPDAPTHWLYRRMQDGTLLGIQSRHEDNPTLVDQDTGVYTDLGRRYIGGVLDKLTGVRKARLRHGKWVAAEGQVWENFDHSIHVLHEWPDWLRKNDDGNPDWNMVVAGVDWGFTNPGVILIAGVDHDGRIYVIHQVYRVQQDMDWWRPKAQALYRQFRASPWACDPAEPKSIQAFRNVGIPASKGDNDIMSGLDAVRTRFNKAGDGKPRLFVMANSLEGRDPELEAKEKPIGLVEEIGAYVFRKTDEGRPIKEDPDPASPDHACDALRYLVKKVDRMFRIGVGTKTGWGKGTMGEFLEHDLEVA